jgi:hypothetical protein
LEPEPAHAAAGRSTAKPHGPLMEKYDYRVRVRSTVPISTYLSTTTIQPYIFSFESTLWNKWEKYEGEKKLLNRLEMNI